MLAVPAMLVARSPTPAMRLAIGCSVLRPILHVRSAHPLAPRTLLGGRPRLTTTPMLCRASSDDTDQPAMEAADYVANIGIFGLWGALMYYILVLAPNQTPLRDAYFIEKLSGLGVDDGVVINAVFTQVWSMMGLWVLIFAALLFPSGRSGNRVPIWPFLTASIGLGMYALMPYFALWRAPSKSQTGTIPPGPSEQTGWQLGLRVTESPITAALMTGTAGWLLYQVASADLLSWVEYSRLFRESRVVHATTIDFLLFTCFVPFWMYNDAQQREWEQRDVGVALLSLLPVLGPCVYLLLRPRSSGDTK